MYYLLDYNIEDEKKDMWFNGPIYNRNQEDVDDVFIFSSGKPLNEQEIQSPFTIIINEKQSRTKNRKQKDKISTSTVGAGFLFLISPTTKELFEKSKVDNMQYFDVTIKSKDLELSSYKIVNITDKIDCVDVAASDVTWKNDEIWAMESLVLDGAKIPKGKKIFLLGREQSGVILIHEDLRKAIEEAGLTGFRYLELENAGSY